MWQPNTIVKETLSEDKTSAEKRFKQSKWSIWNNKMLQFYSCKNNGFLTNEVKHSIIEITNCFWKSMGYINMTSSHNDYGGPEKINLIN